MNLETPIRVIDNNVSFTDFPDKIATVLWTAGCNFQCKYCYNSELINKSYFSVSYKEISEVINKHSSAYWSDGVVITGGEPTIHNNLCSFIKKLKEDFPYISVKIDTNGGRPVILSNVINILTADDYIALDYKTSESNYSSFTGTMKPFSNWRTSYELLFNSNINFELRTTIVKSHHTEEVFNEMLTKINKKVKWFLQPFINKETVLNSELRKEKTTDNEYLLQLVNIAKEKGYNVNAR
jgi:pyruvate formate lyase activating enzyme